MAMMLVYSVIPIVGMGGIGKTTLAQLVYNDDSIKDHFDLRAWVCVSDEFDIIRITKTILLSVTSEPCDMNDLNLLQVKLKEKLSRKKFLLVLDDVWNDNYNDWLALRSPFDAAEPGSKIIVTTRSSKVSSIMTTAADYSLQCLSEEDSLRMLAHDALEREDFTGNPDLKEIGLEILKKCDGLPLATKTIGGLLRTKVNREAWKVILESDIWNLPQHGSDVIPALWLSYYYLPSQLKQCFAYCSLVPKDYEFGEEEIVRLWMAEGFLNGPETKRQIEDLGSQCFEELVSRSFFQASSMDESLFVMHDLINDLAQFVGGEKYFKMEGHEEMKRPSHGRHTSYMIGEYDNIKKFESLFEAKSLRTFLPFKMLEMYECFLSNNVPNDLLPRLKCLRVLSLKRYRITEIPDFIGNLRHLRYLDYSYTYIKGLPDSICTLYNLETLLLRHCRWIEKLPTKIGMLANLCHLDIAGAGSMKEMPSGIGKLTNLRALSNFILGQGDALNIREMQNLSNLKGQLSISELQNVNEAQHAWEAKLSSKPDLDDLELEWCKDFDENLRQKEVETEVLNLLRPHEELKALAIRYYAGIAFPIWIEDPSFKNLQSLKFVNCPNCTLLPAVGKLPLLKDLYIREMKSVTSVGNEFYGENWPNVFPSLETLHFEDMPEWKEWKACEVDEQGRKFRCLRDLLIVGCPKLIGPLPEHFPSLEKLEIRNCQNLEVSISNLPKLCELKIDGCEKVVVGSCMDLWLVKKINLSYISKFACVTRERMWTFEWMKVEDLNVKGCEELVSMWQTEWGWLVPLRSLRNLELQNCPQVASISATEEEEKAEILQLDLHYNIEHLGIKYCEGFQKLSKNLTCLRELEIVGCPKLVSLLADNLPSTLKSLVIKECENLECLLEDGENINFSSTSLLEFLQICECKALKSLSSSSKLPVGLKMLLIFSCPKLEFVAQEIGDNTCLESIEIWYCENIQYLPQGMDKLKSLELRGCEKLKSLPSLNSLQDLIISSCPRATSIPEGGLPTDLTSLYIHEPNVVKSVMEWGLHRLTSIKGLLIDGRNCDAVIFPERGLPTNLTKLSISGPNIVKAVMECGLHELTSLTTLYINGSNCVSFPQEEIKLPPSLNVISILDFKNLRKLSSKGFQHLSSLQHLWIGDCPKLKSLPKKEVLRSLLDLQIFGSPVLKKRCKRDKGKYWPNIAHIPRVKIDQRYTYEL
ncbi:putative disease resistance protein RGA4 [Durio zibethinus]|uniref:Disease resistance protein RGA4 n=1 Tax=Durio zibethinus TaxID=66656 RepID=A0A6P5Z1V2_DURZI|nr:putative disease resistance protein RGA4 [Durio zibethinus]XP_022746540.1 putative disease resistance protein RGA4 [Durio zibethinus]XP_022746541.1 putative disease resistance protein RGA4 [Durio zibethinus]XP_022746542.1 putative disease resistance protein RGA4 [Durio zibethinus]XP_022746543.1 putative disease resistance protein RGA4 [Durio zibethinus]